MLSPVMADNWPQWRGPLGTGVAADGNYPVEFSGDENVAWKVELPGRGSSTPAVWNDQLFVTCGIDGQDGVICYGLDGKERWRKTFGKEKPGKHANATGSNSSPVTDGKHLIVYFKSGNVAGLDLKGNVLWQANLQDKYGKDTLWWDLGTSPVLADGKAIIAVVQEGDSYLVALDLATGNEIWKTARNYKTPQEADQTYSTPQVVQIDGKDVVVTWGADHLTGHDADTGKLLWECGGFNPNNEGYWRTIASATVENGIAIISYGRGKFMAGIRVSGQGDITKSNWLWDHDQWGADVPSPIVKDGKVIVLGDRGNLVCFEADSGKEIWKADLPRNRNKYYASPVLAGDKLYCTREDGVVFVGEVGDDGFNLVSENDMGERIIATPVPIDDSVLIRGETHLYRIDGANTSQASAGS
jgi:outer membrane protein assembly factor BamB